jgi:hypothetical protein
MTARLTPRKSSTHEPIAPLPFALEVCPVTGNRSLSFGQLRFQFLNPCLEREAETGW